MFDGGDNRILRAQHEKQFGDVRCETHDTLRRNLQLHTPAAHIHDLQRLAGEGRQKETNQEREKSGAHVSRANRPA